MSKPVFWDEAARHLAAQDPVLARLIASYPGMHLTRRGDPFTTLARSIVGQQISVKAAQSVWERFSGRVERVAPDTVHRCRLPTLRA
ncbi:MAG: DNA-3-methyladenine glycosylase 2 family protein, partial [Casimicrobiaceae bacterium]